MRSLLLAAGAMIHHNRSRLDILIIRTKEDHDDDDDDDDDDDADYQRKTIFTLNVKIVHFS